MLTSVAQGLKAQFTAAGLDPQVRELSSFYDNYGLDEYPVEEDDEEDDEDEEEEDGDEEDGHENESKDEGKN